MQYSDVPELETYLHIASKQDGSEAEPASSSCNHSNSSSKNKIIRYDLCDDKCKQVEIRPSEGGRRGVKIIDSKTTVRDQRTEGIELRPR
jgi:hypothetical protein